MDPKEEPGDGLLEGRVVDAGFESVTGAQVTASTGSGAERRTTSGSEGRFSFDGIPAGSYRLEARKDEATGQAGPVTVSGDQGPPVTIVLGADASIGGRVLEQDSREPVPGIRLWAWEAALGHRNGAFSDGDGRFRIPVPSPGNYRIFSMDNPNHVDGELTLNVLLAAGEHKDDVVYFIQRGIRLDGTVTRDDAPVADASVELVDLLNDQGGNKGQTVSDRTGRFVFTGQKEGGKYVARAVHPEYGFGESAPVITGPAGAQGNLDVRLRAGQTVAGRVHTADGLGVPGIPLWLLKDGGQPWRPIPGTRVLSLGDGSFQLRNVPPGSWQFVVVTAQTTRLMSQAFQVLDGEETEPVEINLGAGAEGYIEGRVISPEGEPLPRVEVIAHPDTIRLSGVSETGEDGRYRIEGLGPAPMYTLWARGYRLGRVRKSRTDVPVNTSGVDFVLGKMSSISGRVIDRESRAPVQSFHVTGPVIDRDFETTDGSFVIDDIQVIGGVFRFSAKGYLTAVYDAGEIPEGGVVEDVLVELGAPGWIEGRVFCASSGDPIQGARVKLILPGVLPVAMVEREYFWDADDPYTDAQGRFILAAHPEGELNSFVVSYADHVPEQINDSLERKFDIPMYQAPE